MSRRAAEPGLDALLAATSRSFFLSLAALPRATRAPAGLGYLLARAADTVADAARAPVSARHTLLARFTAALQGEARGDWLAELAAVARSGGGTDAEQRLLERMPEALAAYDLLATGDRQAVARVLAVLTRGMRDDLKRFGDPDGQIRALDTAAELLHYTDQVAGCVGRFWTELHQAHLPRIARLPAGRLLAWGERYWRGLQLVNVLRDIPNDLEIGRCYLPRTELAARGLTPDTLLEPRHSAALRGLLDRWIGIAREHLCDGARYAAALPRAHLSLYLASRWPLDLARATLTRLAARPLVPRVKVPRFAVYAILLGSLPAALLAARPRGL